MNPKNESVHTALDKVLGINRSLSEELSEGEYADIYTLMLPLLSKMAQHWHYIKNGKKRRGCSVYTGVSFPVAKLGNASMSFNVNLKLPAKIGEEKVTSVVEKLFAQIRQKEDEEAEASASSVSDGLKELGLE